MGVAGQASHRAGTGLLVGGLGPAMAAVVLGLLSACQWVKAGLKARVGLLMDRAGSQGLWLQGLGSSKFSTHTLVCRAKSWALWWTRLCPGAAVSSGILKAACLLVGGAVSLTS